MKFTAADVLKNWKDWGCNCGPCSIAAATDKSLSEVRPFLGDFEKKRYMNPTMIEQTLNRMRVPFRLSFRQNGNKSWIPSVNVGIARVQFGGPWMGEGVPAGAKYRHTHYVAVRDGSTRIFDHNSCFTSHFGFLPSNTWANGILPPLMNEIKRCDGTFFFTHVWEIQNHSAPFTGHSAAGKPETQNRKPNKMSEDTEKQEAPAAAPATPTQEAPTEAAPAPAAVADEAQPGKA